MVIRRVATLLHYLFRPNLLGRYKYLALVSAVAKTILQKGGGTRDHWGRSHISIQHLVDRACDDDLAAGVTAEFALGPETPLAVVPSGTREVNHEGQICYRRRLNKRVGCAVHEFRLWFAPMSTVTPPPLEAVSDYLKCGFL